MECSSRKKYQEEQRISQCRGHSEKKAFFFFFSLLVKAPEVNCRYLTKIETSRGINEVSMKSTSSSHMQPNLKNNL